MKKFDFSFIEFDSWQLMNANNSIFVKAFEKEKFYQAILDKLRELNKKAFESDGIDLFRDYRYIKAVEIAEERYKYYKKIGDLIIGVNCALIDLRDNQNALKDLSII